MLLSDLLSSLPVHASHETNTAPSFHIVRGYLFSSQFERRLPHRSTNRTAISTMPGFKDQLPAIQ